MSDFFKSTALMFGCSMLACNVHAFWVADSQSEKELKELNQGVTFSETFGQWRDQGQGGVYRLIVVDSEEKYAHSLVYLQWIRTPPQGSKKNAGSVVTSVPIKEINYTAAYKLSDPKVAGADGALGGVAEITGVNNFSHLVQGIRLQPKNVGEYSLTFINGPTERSKAIVKQVENAVFALPVKN